MLSTYLSSLIDKANTEGYLVGSVLGRKRFFPEETYGEAANYPIQNTNAEAIKIAMIDMHNYILKEGLDARLVMNIHDELVVEAKEDIVDKVADKLKSVMGNWLGYFLEELEGGAGCNIGDYWMK